MVDRGPIPPRRTLGDYAMEQRTRYFSSITVPLASKSLEREPTFLSLNMAQGWSSNQNQGFGWNQDFGPFYRQSPYQQEPQDPHIHERLNKLEDTLEKFMQASMINQKNTEAYQKSTEAAIRNVEIQVEQLANQLTDYLGGQFSANTHTNPKDQGMSITTISCKIVGEDIDESLVIDEEVVEKKEEEREKNKSERQEQEKEKLEKQWTSSPIIVYLDAPSKKNEEVSFNVFEANEHPSNQRESFRMDVQDEKCPQDRRRVFNAELLMKAMINYIEDTAKKK